MPPNSTPTSGVADVVRQIGEALAIGVFSLLLLATVLPHSLWPVPYRMGVLGFIGLVFLTTILPPAAKLTADAFGELRFLSSYLGEFPFHHWTLYYHPLLDREVRHNWPGGLHYPTFVFTDEGTTRERLLLDSTIEPMNISGLVLHFVPRLLQTDDPDARQDLMEFFVGFLRFKVEYYQEHGDYSISRRYLGPLSFPTANTQVEPPHDIAREDIKEVNIYNVPLPENFEEFDVTDIDWGRTTEERATKVASYTVDADGSVVETQFSTTDAT